MRGYGQYHRPTTSPMRAATTTSPLGGGGFDGGGFERKASASLLVSPLSRSPSRNAFGVRPAHLRNHVNSLPLTVAHSWGMQILERPGTTGSIGRTVRSYDSHR